MLRSCRSARAGGSFAGFFALFMVLFLDHRHRQRLDLPHDPGDLPDRALRDADGKGAEAQEQAIKDANKEAAAVLGFTSAFAAYGGFFIPKSYGTSISIDRRARRRRSTSSSSFYLTCIAVTWWYYARRNAPMPC